MDEIEIGYKKFKVPPAITGIYLLFDGEEVVYVGQSVDVHSRALAHKNRFAFDSYTFLRCEADCLNLLEATLVLAFNPKENHKLPANPVWGSPHTIASKLDLELYVVKQYAEEQQLKNIRGYFELHDFFALATEIHKRE